MQDLQHNVVNILYTIKGMIEAHKSKAEENCFKCKDEALEHAQSIMSRIYDQSNRALQITNRIRLALKSQENPGEIPPDVSIQEAWGEAVNLLNSKTNTKMPELISHVPEAFPFIKCRRTDLLEIFFTLLVNAVEAMGPDGKIIIRANLQFQNDAKPIAVITISDTGPGIPEDILSRLFEPFFSTKSLEKGNGLGLCIVKGLVRKNLGSISVSSFRGFGTTFTLSFTVSGVEVSRGQSQTALT